MLNQVKCLLTSVGRVVGREFSAATTTLMIFLKVLDEFNQ